MKRISLDNGHTLKHSLKSLSESSGMLSSRRWTMKPANVRTPPSFPAATRNFSKNILPAPMKI